MHDRRWLLFLLAAWLSVGANLVGSARAQSSTDWPSLQGGPSHSGVVAAPDFEAPLRRAWSARLGGDGGVSPAAVAGGLAVVVGNSQIIGLDAASGAVRWRSPRAPGPLVPAAIDGDAGENGIAIFAEGNDEQTGALAAVDLETGQLAWTPLTVRGPIRGAPSIHDGVGFLGGRDGQVVGVNVENGDVEWRSNVSGAVDASPAVDGGRVFVVGQDIASGRATVTALSEDTGEVLWSFSPTAPGLGTSAPTVLGDSVYVGFGDLSIKALDVRDGSIRWSTPSRDAFSGYTTPAASGNRVFMVTLGGDLYRLDARTGEKIWEYQLSGAVLHGAPLLAGDDVYTGVDDGSVKAIDAGSGHLVWGGQLGSGSVGALSPAGDLLLASALDARAEVVAFTNDSQGALLDEASPSAIRVGPAGLNFLMAGAIVLLIVFALFRFVVPPLTTSPDPDLDPSPPGNME